MSYVCVTCGGPLEVETSVAFADGPRHHKGECDYGPYEHHKMPNGSEVWYLDSTHTYHSKVERKGGKWVGQGRWGDLPSPSQIAKFSDPTADNLMDWAARKQVEGVWQLGDLSAFPNADSVKEALKKNKLTWRDLRDQAGDVGTIVHDAFERMLNEGVEGKAFEYDGSAAQAGHLRALGNFFKDCPNIKPLQTEAVVYSQEHRYAGRFDARVEYEGHTFLIDLKTSKYIGRSYHAQLCGYDLAAEECGYGASDRLVILQTREDGTFTLWPCRSDRDTFLHCLSLYRKGKQTDAATRKDYKELKAA